MLRKFQNYFLILTSQRGEFVNVHDEENEPHSKWRKWPRNRNTNTRRFATVNRNRNRSLETLVANSIWFFPHKTSRHRLCGPFSTLPNESFSLKGESGRNGKLTDLELRLWMRSPLPILRQTSTMWCLRKDNIILYPHPPPPLIETGAFTIYTGKFITMETEIVRGKFQQYLLSGQWKRTGHIPDKWRVLC
jgi:hypothetical protein